MNRLLLAFVSMWIPLAGAAEIESASAVADALARATQQRKPVLLDFSAPWCYSCYYMDTHVLNGPQWQAVEARSIVVAVDADSPDGAHWMEQLHVRALPSYVVLNANGDELGRILAEQTRAQFYPEINRILDHGNSLDALKIQAANGVVAATDEVLGIYHARGEAKDGLQWFAALPEKVHGDTAMNPSVALWLSRLELQQAATAKDVAGCEVAAKPVLAGDLGCDRYYELESLMSCVEKLPADQQVAQLQPHRADLEKLLATRIFVDLPTCADQRTAVLVSADLYATLGDKAAEQSVLDRAISVTQHNVGENMTRDRNLVDNLRVYLTRAKRMDEVDALMPKLIAAYPDDYVYADRFGRSLLERGRAAQALPYFEHAAEKAYGINRLRVARSHVKALLALHRQADAEKLVAEVLKENGPWFPKEAEELKASVKS